ncbi:hypothetical protein K9M59_04140 [Candidatus Gracilibacteria bacterium]|nr:hypothetical protein [Candidatus Gracilibacteria bacterium]MCF7819512.1 hypothetical protein [Candidatus Gracilibacteria bacterium]
MRKFFLGLLCLVSTGCSDTDSGLFQQEPTDSFRVESENFHLALPEDWTRGEVPDNSEAVFFAYKDQQSFVILRAKGQSQNLAENLWANAQNDFYFFEEVDFTPEKWVFQGKIDPTDSLQLITQKALALPDSNTFLLGSCSVPTQIEGSECESILDSWQISVDKEPEEK